MEGAVVWGSVLVVSVKNTFIHCQLSPKSEALSLSAARRRARPSKAKRRRWNRWEAAQKAEEEEDTPTHESQGLLPPAVA